MASEEEQYRRDSGVHAGRIIATAGAIATLHGANQVRHGINYRTKQAAHVSKQGISTAATATGSKLKKSAQWLGNKVGIKTKPKPQPKYPMMGGHGPSKLPASIKRGGIRKGGLISVVGATAFAVGHHMVNRPYKHHLSPYNANT